MSRLAVPLDTASQVLNVGGAAAGALEFFMKARFISPHELMLSRGRLLIHVRTEPPSMRGRYLAQMRSEMLTMSMAIA